MKWTTASRMLLISPLMAIGGATTAIIALGLGAPLPRPLMFVSLATMIAWALIVLIQRHTDRLHHATIELQASVIAEQRELLSEILTRTINEE